MTKKILRNAILILLSIGAPSMARPDSDAAADLPYVGAIWRVQQLQFNFHSLTNRYACGALERKISDVLRAVGARSDVAVSAACLGGQFSGSAEINIAVASPVPATEENVRDATTYDGRQHLVARMQQISLPGAADIQRFPAQWERVSLTRNRKLRFSTADCELIGALSAHVFPRLSVSLDPRAYSCTSSANRMRPRVEVAALMVAPLEPLARR